MKRMKRYVAWLMAICMLNFGGAWTGISANAEETQSSDCVYVYSVLTAGDASHNGTASVAVTDVAEDVVQINVPATCELEDVSGDVSGEVSGDASGDVSGEASGNAPGKATYDITKLTGISYASGDADSNALKVIGFEGMVPGVDASLLNQMKDNYYVKVLKEYASGDAYEAVKAALQENCFTVTSLDSKLMRVENPEQLSEDDVFAKVAEQLKVYDLLEDAVISTGQVTVKWYKDEAHEVSIDSDSNVEEDGVYYYVVEVNGYEKVDGSIELEAQSAAAEEFDVVSGDVTLTMRVLDASGDAVRIKAAVADVDAAAGTPYSIPDKVEYNGKSYTVTEIGAGVFGDADKHTKFTSYVIPQTVTTIADKAFGQNLTYDDALLLRFLAETKDALPKLTAQYNINRFGLVFCNKLTENDINSWRNDSQSQLSNYQSFFVANPATDKILMAGNVQAADSALYTQYLYEIAITASDFTDFESKAPVAVVGGWDNPYYAFNFADSNHNYSYTYRADGYGNIVTGTRTVIPYTASGFSYVLEGYGLYVTAYNADKDMVSSAEKKANKEVDIPGAESDATGAVYSVIGIRTMNRNTTLEHLNIPASIGDIKEDAFIGCDFMQINVATDNPSYASAGGFLYNKDMTKLISAACASGKTYLPAGILLIGDHAFESNGRVQDLYIPASVTKIGESNNGHSLQATQLRDIYFFNSDNITTLTFMGSVFGGATANIWVPTGTKAAYEAAIKNQWQGNIVLRDWIPTYDETITLTDYKEFPLTAVNGVNKTYTWTTSDANVVGISATTAATANIHAMTTSGIATVTATATDGSGMSKWQVTVNVPSNLENPWSVVQSQYSLKASKSSVTMGAKSGKKVDSITLTISASDKSKVTVASASSSNKKVATVTKKSNKITIKSAAKKGTATITVKDANGKSVKIKVTVKAAPKKAKLKKSSVTLKKKKTYTIALKNTPSAKVTYKSNKKKIATVSSAGKVTAKKKGSCKITVTTYNGKKAILKVKVK